MKKLQVNTKDTSCEELTKIAQKSGFLVKESSKHRKIESSNGKFITMIPRHKRLKRETVKGIIEAFNRFGSDIDCI